MTQLRPTYTVTRDPADQRRRAQAQTLAALQACAILHGYIVGLQRVADDATADPATQKGKPLSESHKQRLSASISGQPQRCGFCGEAGHKRTTCPMRKNE